MYIVRIYISQILYMNLILKDTIAYILNKIKKKYFKKTRINIKTQQQILLNSNLILMIPNTNMNISQ